jgi:hypothetical protein
MQQAVKRFPRASVALFSLASTTFLLGWRPAMAQQPARDSTAPSPPLSATKTPLARNQRNRRQPEVFHNGR